MTEGEVLSEYLRKQDPQLHLINNIAFQEHFFLWPFDTIQGHGFPLQGFTFTLRHTTLGRTSLDE